MRYDLPPFLQTPSAAIDWLRENTDILDQLERDFPPDYPKEHIQDDVDKELARIAWSYWERACSIANANGATLYRAIRIPVKRGLHNVNWDCLGKAWSVEYKGAGVYGGDPYGDVTSREVVLVGDVKAKYIDWEYGITSFAYYGEDQWEISLLPNSPVLITGVVLRLRDGRDDQWRKLSRPIRGNTGPAQESWKESCAEVVGRRRRLTPEEVDLGRLG